MEDKKRKRKNDIILLASLLIIGIALFVAVNALKTDGAQVDVIVDGNVVEHFSLSKDRQVNLNYGGHNHLVIENGEARIDDADCPDQLCTNYRPISKAGETIVCLPHKLVIKISGGDESDYDGVLQ